MKQIFSALFALASLLATPALAGTIDTEYDYTETCNTYSLYLIQPLAGKVGAFAYAVTTSTNWSETYGGLSYAASNNFSLSFGAGAESGTSKTRFGGSVWSGKGRISALWLWERGGSGKWNKLVLKYQATDQFAFGYVEKTFAGNGLYLEYRPRPNWTVKAYDYDSGRMLSIIRSVKF